MNDLSLTLWIFFSLSVIAHLYISRVYVSLQSNSTYLKFVLKQLESYKLTAADYNKSITYLKTQQIKIVDNYITTRKASIIISYYCIIINAVMLTYPLIDLLHDSIVGHGMIVIMIISNSVLTFLINNVYQAKRIVSEICNKYVNILKSMEEANEQKKIAGEFFEKFAKSIDGIIDGLDKSIDNLEKNKNNENE